MSKVLWLVATIGLVLTVLLFLRRLALRSARLHLTLVIGFALAVFLAVALLWCHISAEISYVWMGIQLSQHGYESPNLSRYGPEIVKDLRLRCLLPLPIRLSCSVPDDEICGLIEDYVGRGSWLGYIYSGLLTVLLCGGIVYLLTRKPPSAEPGSR